MPTLAENQRAWLDKALQNKGRFTLKSSVKKDWENYVRRREKTALAFAGMPQDAPQYTLLKTALENADRLAEAGKFSDAYKSLDAAKKMGKAASKERVKTISLSELNSRLNVLRSHVGDIRSNVDFARSFADALVDKVKQMRPCSAAPNLSAAVLRRQEIVKEEQIVLGEQAGRHDYIDRAYKQIAEWNPSEAIKTLERDIATYQSAGLAEEVRPYAERLAQLKQKSEEGGGRYNSQQGWQTKRDFDNALAAAFLRLKDLSSFKGETEAEDSETTEARGQLNETTNLEEIEKQEKLRLDRAKQAMVLAGLKDRRLKQPEQPVKLQAAPELKSFDGATLFADLDEDALPDEVSDEKALEIIGKAKSDIVEVMKNLDPTGDEMFSLLLMSPKELALMCNQQLTGVDSDKGITPSHEKLLTDLTRELRAEILKNAPNKMKSDGSEVTINGKTYTLQAVIGQGGMGSVKRYTDGEKTVVVKSLKGDATEKKFEEMKREMTTHRQLLNGDGETTGTDNLIDMKGAAVGEDGSLHMVMEEAEGGDLGAISQNMQMLSDMGILPDEARTVLGLDMMKQAVKGMKAMQERGLVHNDLKLQNMMMDRDGTLKIIDFGESRFVGDDGTIPNRVEGGYQTTGGYSSPEHERDGTVDDKADAYALSGIVKMLNDRALVEDTVWEKQKQSTAVGRLTEALSDDDPKKRPSLDAVLMSSCLDQLDSEHDQDQVEELKEGMAEVNTAIQGIKVSLTAQELKDHEPGFKMSGMWSPYYSKIKQDGGEVPLAVARSMVPACQLERERALKGLAKAKPADLKDEQEKLDKAERKIAFWTRLCGDRVEKARTDGSKALQNAIDDPTVTVDVPGDKGGKLTIKAALALRDDNLKTIAQIQSDFESLLETRPEMAQEWLSETNKGLVALDKQNKAIDKAVFDAVGPDAKYLLAEQKLAKVTAKFGPRVVPGGGGGAPEQPKPPKPEVEVKLDENGIPVPPPLPGEEKVEAK